MFFGVPGSCNDVNVLDRSTLIAKVLAGHFQGTKRGYMLQGMHFMWPYFLGDGMYMSLSMYIHVYVPIYL